MNGKQVKIVGCVVVVLMGAPLRADEVVLTPGQVDVVLPKKAWPVEKFAAEELTNFLSRVLGADVPIVRKPAADRAAILLGRATELDVSTLERDAFRMKVESCRRDGDSTGERDSSCLECDDGSRGTACPHRRGLRDGSR